MLQQIINEALAKKQEERNNRERSGKFSPSSLGKCYRAQIWNRKNEPITNQPDERILRVFSVGNVFHDWVQGFLPLTGSEVLVETDDLKGYADIVTDTTVYDIKTMHSKGFWWMKKEGYDINKEKYPNILQVCTYGWLLNKPKAILCFISKDDLCIDEYGFEVEKWIPEIKKELNKLIEFWDKKILPPANPRCYIQKDGSSKECGYCSWSIKGKCKEA